MCDRILESYLNFGVLRQPLPTANNAWPFWMAGGGHANCFLPTASYFTVKAPPVTIRRTMLERDVPLSTQSPTHTADNHILVAGGCRRTG